MPDNTPILQLPLILPAQAQKHVTHNEALRLLDVMVQLSVLTRNLTVPPATPSVGDRHIVPAGATGTWAGQAGKIALYAVTGWEFVTPLTGWTAQVMTEGQAAVFDGLVWKVPSDGTVSVARLGISTAADATNRLAVSSPATLLNHAGAGHQVKVNKAAAGDTASLLFQTGFSGRAEMGTAGTDDFAIKVSADGSAFFTALQSDGTTGEVTLPAPVHLGGQASDPASPPDGTLWLNTTTGEVKLRSNGITLVVGGGGGVADGDKGDVTVSSVGLVCLDVKTGKVYWEERLKGDGHSSSPILVNKNIYVTSENGTGLVIEPSKTELKILHENTMKERTFATIVPADGALYLRTESAIFKFAEKK